MNKAFFLDRDGVINIEKDYVYKIEDFEFIQGVHEACRTIQKNGYKIIVITNQSGIARGLYTEEQFHQLNEWMLAKFKSAGVDIAEVYFCPHHPTEGIGVYHQDCECRKPKAGMLVQAAEEHTLDLSQSVLVGDRQSDIQAGFQANIPSLYLVSANNSKANTDAYLMSENLISAVRNFFSVI